MIITGFNGTNFASAGFIPGVDWLWGQWQMTPATQARQGATPVLTGGTISERAIPVQFGYRGVLSYENAFIQLMGILDPVNTVPRTLTAQLNDGTAVQCEAVVQVTGAPTGDDDANWLEATFITMDPYWKKTNATVQGPAQLATNSDSMAITNGGSTTVFPLIERSAPTVPYMLSSRSRFRVTVTNGGTLPLDRETLTVLMEYVVGYTGFSAIDMIKDGIYYPVSKTTNPPNGAMELVMFPVTVDTGTSETFDLICTNGARLYPRTLDSYTRFDGNYTALAIDWENYQDATTVTSTTIGDLAANWAVGQWAGACVILVGGGGSIQARRVVSNTATVLTVARAFTTVPDTTTDFTVIGSGAYFDGGQASAGAASSLTDAAQSWDPGTLTGGTIRIIAGTGTGQSREIASNTATQVTTKTAWATAPNSTSVYSISRIGYHRYYVDQTNNGAAHRGGWQINKRFSRPSRIRFGGADILNGWSPFLLNDNGDDFNSARVTPVNVGNIHYWPMLDADRRRKQDRKLPEEGQADGVAIYHPLGYSGIRFDYSIKNTNGICEAVFLCREAGGDEFEAFVPADDQTQANLTNVAAQYVNLAPLGSPQHIYMGLQPNGWSDGDAETISKDAKESDIATLRWNDTLILWVDIASKLSYTLGSIETVVPVDDEFRVGKYALQIGKRDGQRLWISTTDALVIDCARAKAYVDTGTDLVDVTYAVYPVVYEDRDGDGVEESYAADRWLPIPPGNSTLLFSSENLVGGFDCTLTTREQVYG
jgi:hypothetical protein